MDAQTDLSVSWVHMSDGTFSYVPAYIYPDHTAWICMTRTYMLVCPLQEKYSSWSKSDKSNPHSGSDA